MLSNTNFILRALSLQMQIESPQRALACTIYIKKSRHQVEMVLLGGVSESSRR